MSGRRAGWIRSARRIGQGLVEYGIILGLAALLIVILLVFFDDQVAAVLAWLSSQLP
jgi:Flp pilus assembly pilin Flp